MKEIVKASEQSSRDIRQVALANKQQSKATARLVGQLADVRRVTQRNAEGAGRTRGGTTDLLRQAQTLAALMANGKGKSTNGRHKR
jgi:methyl-accepting chemotaxis protein